MITELPLGPFVIINLTSLTAGVCMKVRFRSKVTRGFSFSPLCNSHSPLRGSLTRGKFKKNLWDQGTHSLALQNILSFDYRNYLKTRLCICKPVRITRAKGSRLYFAIGYVYLFKTRTVKRQKTSQVSVVFHEFVHVVQCNTMSQVLCFKGKVIYFR